MADDLDEARETQFLATAIDPLARKILDATDPWDAYDTAGRILGSLVDDIHWLPHGGNLYTVWAELIDLFETGETPIPAALAVLRQAATDWLGRPVALTTEFIETWSERTQMAANDLFDRDGTFWSRPEE
ncbi:hypothetical protein [Cellulomonas gilvus]|uniref:Uncharacterized protein n=1 Tax=Cellulomonas gilvus (strain ATCC 13127 / NRRL B-14078) TaxID=593907 RepID=F8A631_CELGA|nr:hypothetical protein [Cellulomonas gilvus]AEI11046.1 hypothetical protein Celgi_0524 [Cellulomonas gilvus ATCC 13127]